MQGYRGVWEQTMGQQGSLMIAIVNMIKPVLPNLMYSMILADTAKSLVESAGFTISRTASLLIVTFVALLPLCLLKNLNALRSTSALGTIGMFSIAIVTGARYFDGSYDVNRDGRFVKDLPDKFKPSFGTTGAMGSFSPKVFILICLLFEAFVAHYNAPRFFAELKNGTSARFRLVCMYSFGTSSLVFISVIIFGFLTFGASCDGFILNNYSGKDRLMTFCRFAVALSVIFTYPITFLGIRYVSIGPTTFLLL
jgi:amino acid permease